MPIASTMTTIEPYQVATISTLADRVRGVLAASGVVAVPTESFYGLGVRPHDELALAALRRLKGRSEGKPILVLIGDRRQLEPLVRMIPAAARCLMDAFWPGPLTIVFPAAEGLSDVVTAGTASVGIRLSAWPPLVDLLKRVGPLTGTSANREGATPARTAQEVLEQLSDAVRLIVDAGPTPGGLPSTVIDVCGSIRIVREGAIPRAIIAEQLNRHGFHLETTG